ncbi:hypothetical protein [Runella zeae]|uniref:hypothetical protein n=1 Tax=Runella zeae TaxID=94255 RepID=UPI002355FBF4|nr:hypothetical protein [Runella zeae]
MKPSDVKKALTSLATAKKSVVVVLGEVAALSFLPIEAGLAQALERAEAETAFANLTPEEVVSKKAELSEKALESLVNEANEELAKIMKARNPQPKADEATEVAPEDLPPDDSGNDTAPPNGNPPS